MSYTYDELQKIKTKLEKDFGKKKAEILNSSFGNLRSRILKARNTIEDLVYVKAKLLKYTLDNNEVDTKGHENIFRLALLIDLNKTILNVQTTEFFHPTKPSRRAKLNIMKEVQREIDQIKEKRNEFNCKKIEDDKIKEILDRLHK